MANNIRFLLILTSLASKAKSQVPIGCNVPGKCELATSVANPSVVSNYNDCLSKCQLTTDCLFFTLEPVVNICSMYSDCYNLSIEFCPDCVSGDKECPLKQCFLEGACLGPIVGVTLQWDAAACKVLCDDDQRANYFTYDSVSSLCQFTTTCDVIQECDACVHGAKNCFVEPEGSEALFVIGGNACPGTLADVEGINLGNTLQACPKPKDYPFPVEGHVMQMVNGDVTVCGGMETSLCYVYDFEIDDWMETASMNQDRYAAAAVTISAGTEMWVVGGLSGPESNASNYLASTEFLIDGEFRDGPILPEGMAFTCLLAINDSHIFLAGGLIASTLGPSDKTYILDLQTGQSRVQLRDMTTPRYGHMCALVGTKIVVLGGMSNEETFLSSSEEFSLEDLTWTSGPQFPHGISQASVVTMREDDFLVVGGWVDKEEGDFCADNRMYKYNGGNWREQVKTLEQGRRRTVAAGLSLGSIQCDGRRGM